MDKMPVMNIVAGGGHRLDSLEVTYSTLIGLKVRNLGTTDNKESYLIVLADEITKGWNAPGMKLMFRVHGEDLEEYVLQTRAQIMHILPARSFFEKKPDYELLDVAKSGCIVERACSGFYEIGRLFEDAGKDYEIYTELFDDRLVSWRKTNILGRESDPELRFTKKEQE
jgi:hypothetical protein